MAGDADDGAGFEVDLRPEDGEGFANADAAAGHEGGEVGEVGVDGGISRLQLRWLVVPRRPGTRRNREDHSDAKCYGVTHSDDESKH